jgi:hypothetical protein
MVAFTLAGAERETSASRVGAYSAKNRFEVHEAPE